MKSKIRFGVWAVLLMIAFTLAGCAQKPPKAHYSQSEFWPFYSRELQIMTEPLETKDNGKFLLWTWSKHYTYNSAGELVDKKTNEACFPFYDCSSELHNGYTCDDGRILIVPYHTETSPSPDKSNVVQN